MSRNEHDHDDDLPDEGADYLWDRSGPVDARVAELEELLGTLRYERSMPAVEPPARARRPSVLWWLAIAAGVALVCWGWMAREGAEVVPPVARMHLPEVSAPMVVESGGLPVPARRTGPGWPVEVVSGAPAFDGQPVADKGTLHVGSWIETDASSRARVAIADIGTLDVEPGSRLRLLGTGADEHQVELARGRVRATVDAPPRVFLVQTPRTNAVDLGCQYQLEVLPDGSATLNVRTGWVALESRSNDARDSTLVLPSYVPAGCRCRADAEGNPGLPVRDDAAAAFVAAAARFDAGASGAMGERFDASAAAAVTELVAQAAEGDEVTLWHLLARVPAGEREAVYHKLAALGRPADDRAAVLRGDMAAHETWGRALGVVPPLGWPEEGPPDRPKPTWDPEQWSAPSGGPVPGPAPGPLQGPVPGPEPEPRWGGPEGGGTRQGDPGGNKRDPGGTKRDPEGGGKKGGARKGGG